MEGDGGLHSVVVLTEWISIHALRVEGDGQKWRWDRGGVISIHALRVEGDLYKLRQIGVDVISIHALRVEGD